MESNKIIVNFARVKNVLIADIVNTPKELVGKGEIVGNERYKVASEYVAALTNGTLYLTGSSDDNSGYLSCDYGTEGEAQAALECYSELINKYNKGISSTGVRAGVLNWRRAE